MRSPPLLSALCLLAALATPAAAATVFALKQAAEPATYGPAIDVIGIRPGMPPDKVQAILTARYGDVQVTQDYLGLEYNGNDVNTAPYVTKMYAHKDADEVTVWFATPTTGSGAIEITRQTNYFNQAEAPAQSQVRTELTAKFGPPGFDGPAVGTGEVRLLAWSFNGDKAAPCPRSTCRAYASEGLSVSNMTTYQRAVATGHKLTVIGTMLATLSDPNKVVSVLVTVNDAATKLKTLELAVAQMKAAASAKPKR